MNNFEPERLRRSSEIRSVSIGEITVTYLPDGLVQIKPRGLFPGTTPPDWADYQGHIDEAGYLTASSGALLIEKGSRAMLIDSGYGPMSVPANPANPVFGEIRGGGLLASLAEVGRKPGEIEAVTFGHLHMDHVGWAALPAHANPFKDAACLVHKPEWRPGKPAHGVTVDMLDSLAGRLTEVADGEEIFPGVRVVALPGHTPGHAGFRISSQGEELIAFGDVMHSPVQVYHPEWQVIGDPGPDEAVASRRRILDELAGTGKIGFGCHFADVVFGRVERSGAGPAWTPLA
jgi:glyoxylase-like metal-dependent hydrolase (beta-lactamase superfamily II)